VFTDNLGEAGRQFPKPVDRIGYFDRLQIHLVEITNPEVDFLREQCAHFEIDKGMWPASPFEYRVQLVQPSPLAIDCLDRRDPDQTLINAAEVAVDYSYDTDEEAEEVTRIVKRGLIRRWHPHHHKVKSLWRKRKAEEIEDEYIPDDEEIGVERVDGPGWARIKSVIYREGHQRLTGQCHAVHVEIRLRSAQACKGAKVVLGKLGQFDFVGIHKRRLAVYDIDVERLGRLLRNRWNGTKSRDPLLRKLHLVEVSQDWRLGSIMLARYSNLQEAVDGLGGLRKLGACLVPVEVGWWG